MCYQCIASFDQEQTFFMQQSRLCVPAAPPPSARTPQHAPRALADTFRRRIVRAARVARVGGLPGASATAAAAEAHLAAASPAMIDAARLGRRPPPLGLIDWGTVRLCGAGRPPAACSPAAVAADATRRRVSLSTRPRCGARRARLPVS